MVAHQRNSRDLNAYPFARGVIVLTDKVNHLSGVTEALVTYGSYNIVVSTKSQNFGQLDALITEIRKIEEIVQLSTLVGS